MKVKNFSLPFRIPEFHPKNIRSERKHQRSTQSDHHINPRYRAYGKARIDSALRIQNQQDWDTLWKTPKNQFAFTFPWGSSWKLCMEYRVDDYPAEIGFWIDILGMPVNAFGPDYAQFTGPSGEFTFAVTPTSEGQNSTSPDSIRIQFLVEDVIHTVEELLQRSVVFDIMPTPVSTDSPIQTASFRTPHGIIVDLWGEVLSDNKKSSQPDPTDIPGHRSEKTEKNFQVEEVKKVEMVSPSPVSPGDEYVSKEPNPIWRIYEDTPKYQSPQTDAVNQSESFETPVKNKEPDAPKYQVPLYSKDDLDQDTIQTKDIPDSEDVEEEEEEFQEEITYEPIDDLELGTENKFSKKEFNTKVL